jgi:hypothetical protein
MGPVLGTGSDCAQECAHTAVSGRGKDSAVSLAVSRPRGRLPSSLRESQDRQVRLRSESKGRFRPNVALPIPFDGQSRLEVDLLCADARVAIELDGAQHLADRMAYRSDRRKDQLLQENDYFVLRFLAEDVGKELDLVLDAVLRALSRRATTSTAVSPLRVIRSSS